MGTNSDCSWQGKPQWWIDFIKLLVILALLISWYPNIIESLSLPTDGNEWQSLHHPLHCGLQLPLCADSHACQGRGFQRWHFLWNRHRSWLLSGDEKEHGLDGTLLISETIFKVLNSNKLGNSSGLIFIVYYKETILMKRYDNSKILDVSYSSSSPAASAIFSSMIAWDWKIPQAFGNIEILDLNHWAWTLLTFILSKSASAS